MYPRATTLDGVDWDDMAPRLLSAAHKIWKRLGLGAYRAAPSPEDLVQEAVSRVFEGKRNMNPEVGAFENLYWIMHSQAHAFTKRQRSHGSSVLDDDMARRTPPCVKARSSLEAEEFRDTVMRIVADDDVLREMARIWLAEGPTHAHDLARRIGVPVNLVYSKTRKLKRRMSRWQLMIP